MPWFVLLAILGINARLKSIKATESRSRLLPAQVEVVIGGVLLLVSVVINTIGATSHAAWLWNIRPRNVDSHPERLWDWRQPQFLAGYLPYPPPKSFPMIGLTRTDFTKPNVDEYLWYGWNDGPPDARWAEKKAAIIFTLSDELPPALHLNLTPYLVPGKLTTQHVAVSLNGLPLTSFTLDASGAQLRTIDLRNAAKQEKNVLVFDLPNAESPQKLGEEPDPRPRSIKLNWIEFAEMHNGK